MSTPDQKWLEDAKNALKIDEVRVLWISRGNPAPVLETKLEMLVGMRNYLTPFIQKGTAGINALKAEILAEEIKLDPFRGLSAEWKQRIEATDRAKVWSSPSSSESKEPIKCDFVASYLDVGQYVRALEKAVSDENNRRYLVALTEQERAAKRKRWDDLIKSTLVGTTGRYWSTSSGRYFTATIAKVEYNTFYNDNIEVTNVFVNVLDDPRNQREVKVVCVALNGSLTSDTKRTQDVFVANVHARVAECFVGLDKAALRKLRSRYPEAATGLEPESKLREKLFAFFIGQQTAYIASEFKEGKSNARETGDSICNSLVVLERMQDRKKQNNAPQVGSGGGDDPKWLRGAVSKDEAGLQRSRRARQPWVNETEGKIPRLPASSVDCTFITSDFNVANYMRDLNRRAIAELPLNLSIQAQQRFLRDEDRLHKWQDEARTELTGIPGLYHNSGGFYGDDKYYEGEIFDLRLEANDDGNGYDISTEIKVPALRIKARANRICVDTDVRPRADVDREKAADRKRGLVNIQDLPLSIREKALRNLARKMGIPKFATRPSDDLEDAVYTAYTFDQDSITKSLSNPHYSQGKGGGGGDARRDVEELWKARRDSLGDDEVRRNLSSLKRSQVHSKNPEQRWSTNEEGGDPACQFVTDDFDFAALVATGDRNLGIKHAAAVSRIMAIANKEGVDQKEVSREITSANTALSDSANQLADQLQETLDHASGTYLRAGSDAITNTTLNVSVIPRTVFAKPTGDNDIEVRIPSHTLHVEANFKGTPVTSICFNSASALDIRPT